MVLVSESDGYGVAGVPQRAVLAALPALLGGNITLSAFGHISDTFFTLL
jgi:hypothetical protein